MGCDCINSWSLPFYLLFSENTVKTQEGIHSLGCWARCRDMRRKVVKCNVIEITRNQIDQCFLYIRSHDLDNVEKI